MEHVVWMSTVEMKPKIEHRSANVTFMKSSNFKTVRGVGKLQKYRIEKHNTKCRFYPANSIQTLDLFHRMSFSTRELI